MKTVISKNHEPVSSVLLQWLAFPQVNNDILVLEALLNDHHVLEGEADARIQLFSCPFVDDVFGPAELLLGADEGNGIRGRPSLVDALVLASSSGDRLTDMLLCQYLQSVDMWYRVGAPGFVAALDVLRDAFRCYAFRIVRVCGQNRPARILRSLSVRRIGVGAEERQLAQGLRF